MVYNQSKILIVDDDEAICELVSEGLVEEGYTCDIASTAYEALTKLQNYNFDIVLLDIKLPDKSGMELLSTFQTLYLNIGILMMTAVNDIDTAIQAMKLGASDYVVKPFTIDKLRTSISTVLEENNKRYISVSGTIRPIDNINNGMKIANRSLGAINAIAYGVDAWLDHLCFYSKIVTEKTVEVARSLGLPRIEIKKWAVARDKLYSQRDEQIKSMLSKLERSPIAQVMFGFTRSVHQSTESSHKQN